MAHETDYLIIGAGAVGLGIADVLLSETDATLTLVDRDHAPGGHWNRAYPFVRLHQPGMHYGIMSSPLDGTATAPEAGMATLSTGAAIRANFQKVLDDVLIASGRVRYIPMSEASADGTVTSLLGGAQEQITVRRKVIEAYHGGGTIPATHKPGFEVDDDAAFAPVNVLGDLGAAAAHYVILGSGKTGIDACLWLLGNGVAGDRISWVMPRDSWFMDRGLAQPGAEFYEAKLRSALNENTALIEANSVEDLFDRLESTGNLLRLDPNVRPTSYKCATVTQQELETLRQIKSVVRLGHIERVSRDRIVMKQGELALPEGALCIDCTATAIPSGIKPPIFRPGQILMNAVRTCQPAFSAAVIGHLEATRDSDDAKNALARVVPLPRDDVDWLRMNFVNRQNQFAWLQDGEMRSWLKTCRLDALTNAQRPDPVSPEAQAIGAQLKETAFASSIRLKQMVDALDAT
ncbi:MAG: NAD(P)-binding protein [Sedimentitalea sp.]